MTATAFLRDASWRDRPNTSSPKQYHLQSTRRPGITACGVGVILDGQNERPAREVVEPSRCRRNGCRQLWPPATAATTTGPDRG